MKKKKKQRASKKNIWRLGCPFYWADLIALLREKAQKEKCPRHWGNDSIYWVRYLRAAVLPYPYDMQTTTTPWNVKGNLATFFNMCLYIYYWQALCTFSGTNSNTANTLSFCSLGQGRQGPETKLIGQWGFPWEEKVLGYTGLTPSPIPLLQAVTGMSL